MKVIIRCMSFLGLNLFSKKQKITDFVGIDIGSSAIKVVQLKNKSGKVVLGTYGSIALGPYGGLDVGRSVDLSPEKITEALINILREAKVSTSLGGVAIPFRSSLTSIIEMPDLGSKKLAQMVPNEAKKYIPTPISEVSLDWTVLPEDQYKVEKKSDNPNSVPMLGVLIIAVHNEILEKYKGIMSSSNINPNFFEIEVYSALKSSVDQNKNPIMIFDLGSQFSKIYIAEKGIIKTSHTINKGSQDMTVDISKFFDVSISQAEILKREYGLEGSQGKKIYESISTTLDYIFSDTNKVLLNHQKKFGKGIEKIVLIGGGSVLKGFAGKAQNIFNVEVGSGNPFKKIEAPAFLENTLKEVGPEFAVSVGLALRGLGDVN